MSKRSKRFADLVAAAKATSLIEEMDLGGFRPTKLDAARAQDWLGVLAYGVANALEAVRQHPADDQLRKSLALLVATAEEWEKRL